MIFKLSIVACIIGILLAVVQSPFNLLAVVYSVIGLIFSIAFLLMHNDIAFLKSLHEEDFKKRDRTDIKIDKE